MKFSFLRKTTNIRPFKETSMYARQDMFEVMICERPYFDLGQRLIRKASSAWHSKGQKTNVLGAFETCRVFATRPRMCLCVCHACQFAFCSASSLPPSSRALSPFLPSLPPPSVWIDLFLSREGARRPIHTTPAQSPHKNGRRKRERERERERERGAEIRSRSRGTMSTD